MRQVGQAVEEAVDDVAVEPGDGPGDAVEDDALRDEEVKLVHVEPAESGVVQAGHGGRHAVGNRAFLAVEGRGDGDGHDGHDDAGSRYRPVQVDSVCRPVAADEVPEGDESGHDGDRRQEDERHGHGFRRLVGRVFVAAFLAPKNVVVETEHVESRQARDEAHHHAEDRAELECGRQNLVLAEEAGEWRYARDGQAGDEEGDVGHRHVFPKSAHVAHLVAMHGVDNGAGAEEQEGLEHGVGEEVEHGGHVAQPLVAAHSGNAEGHHHESDLGDGGEGEHPLDVRLHAGDDGGVEGREGSDDRNQDEHFRRFHGVDGEEPRHEVDTRDDHGGRMNQRRHGRGAFHRVRQPDVQGEHGGLARATHEDEGHGPAHHGAAHERRARGLGEQGGVAGVQNVERECVRVVGQNEDADEESQVSEAGDDERLLGSGHGLGLRVVESNQQVGGNTHQFPENVHLEDVRGHHQPQHGEGEEGKEGVITLETPLAVHVAQTVDVDHERHGGDDYQHHHGNGVEKNSELDAQRVGETQPLDGEESDGLPHAVHAGHGEVGGRRRIGQQRAYAQDRGSNAPRHDGLQFCAQQAESDETQEWQ